MSTRVTSADQAPPRAVLLDALGTLIGIEPPWQPFVALLEERHAISITTEEALGALAAEMSYYRSHCLAAGDAASLADLRAACSDVVAAALGGPVARLERAALTRALLDALRFAAYPDVAPALAALRRRGVHLVVLSNWDISLHDALASSGLTGLLDGVVCSAEHGEAKPAPGIFAAAVELAGVPAGRAIHVGDSYEEDVLGARAAGIEPVLLSRRSGAGGLIGAQSSGPVPDVRTISSLAELSEP
ncbi:MAG: putative hydrolase of the superfamily [Solirubrobacteraceae bacterium]|jgi:putative hydrolase of the HAD superfamily|nr:putative hydrolase of the superfamily [Solirubrobacteraceae bacterium]